MTAPDKPSEVVVGGDMASSDAERLADMRPATEASTSLEERRYRATLDRVMTGRAKGWNLFDDVDAARLIDAKEAGRSHLTKGKYVADALNPAINEMLDALIARVRELEGALRLARGHIANCPCSPTSGCSAARDRVVVDAALSSEAATPRVGTISPEALPATDALESTPKTTGTQP